MGAEAKSKRTKAKREDIENDDSLKMFDREMELCKVSVSDRKHPLSDYPENHLLATLRHIAFDGERSSINLLIRTYFECYGYEVSQQTVSDGLGILAASRATSSRESSTSFPVLSLPDMTQRCSGT